MDQDTINEENKITGGGNAPEAGGGDSFADCMLAWYDENRRVLPWREDPTPYHVWLSEIMLQQTRAQAVKGYYSRFLAALPDIPALASAPEELCMKLWEGLGYYSRVRNLRKGAGQIMERYGGKMPSSCRELLTIAGIGPYTAAAISSIAFHERVPAVDGNLLRVFARLAEYPEDVRTERAKKAAFSFFMQRIPADRPGDFNQALMDLGAGICVPHGAPRCAVCPVRAFCSAFKNDRTARYPAARQKKERPRERRTVLLILSGGKAAVRRRPARGLLAGLYEFPNVEGFLTEQAAEAYVRGLGFLPREIKPLPPAKHIFTHKEWDMRGYAVRAEIPDGSASRMKNGTGAKRGAMRAETPVQGALRENGSEYAEGTGLEMRSLAEIESRYPVPSAFKVYMECLRKMENPDLRVRTDDGT